MSVRPLLLCSTFLMALLLLGSAVKGAFAGEAMPYTDVALDRLNAAMDRIKPPREVEGDDDLRVKNYIGAYRKIFAAAGYDYERSIMRIINDIQFERYRVNKVTITLNRLARELLRLHVKTGIDPRTHLSEGCGELLIQFRDLIRSNTKKYGGC